MIYFFKLKFKKIDMYVYTHFKLINNSFYYTKVATT